jgi:hypothetical protein
MLGDDDRGYGEVGWLLGWSGVRRDLIAGTASQWEFDGRILSERMFPGCRICDGRRVGAA